MTVAVRGADGPAEGKIDEGLDDARLVYPVFVRMADQLIGGRGEFERFCHEHEGVKRRALRPKIIATLRAKADGSWGRVAGLVAELEKSGGVRSVERLWIVNGFACEATGEACRRLAASDAVSFVYLQRGPLRQIKRPPKPGGPTPPQVAAVRRVLSAWKDDSDEPFSTRGI
jgi:hypothetical protein